MRLNKPAVVAVSGFCVLIFSLLCAKLIFPKLENYLIMKETALMEGSKAFESWKKIPFPFKFKIYFFNVTNPGEVQTGSKPLLTEIGPYVYDEFRKRKILSINEENDTIKYVQRRFYKFNEGESGCRSQNDLVTILNFGVVSTANKVNAKAPMILPLVNEALPFLYPGIKNIFITSKVQTILFDGLLMSCESSEVEMICQTLQSKKPPTLRLAENDRDYLISLFHHINASDDGPYEILRGFADVENKGRIVGFRGETVLSQWSEEPCNQIFGTDLTINPNYNQQIPNKIQFFAADFCRSFSVNFRKEIDYAGITTYNFASFNLFEDEEECFCGGGGDASVCPPLGTMNVGPCVDSPIILSHPHFLGARKNLLDYVEGLAPDKSKHDTFITLEPKTGLALAVKTRFQMNLFVQKIEGIDLLQNVSEGVFPFIWLEESAEVPPDILQEIRDNFSKLKIFDIVKYLLAVLGIILLVVALVYAMMKDKICCFTKRPVKQQRVSTVLPQYQNKEFHWRIAN